MITQIWEVNKGLDSHGSNISMYVVTYWNMQTVLSLMSQITVIAKLQKMS